MAECNNRKATCKDCLHVNVCIFRNAGEDEEICRQFINKAGVANALGIPVAAFNANLPGQWLRPTVIDGRSFDIPHCSVCSDVPCDTKNYCPNCGAKMDGGNDDG